MPTALGTLEGILSPRKRSQGIEPSRHLAEQRTGILMREYEQIINVWCDVKCL